MSVIQPSFIKRDAREYVFEQAGRRETPRMRRVREACEAEGLPVIGPDTGGALAALAAAGCVGRGEGGAALPALEVGCLYGYSALWIASGLAGGAVETIEMEDAHADVAEQNFREAGLHGRATVHRGRALDVLPGLEGPYGLVFLDAAKAEYPAYLEHALRLTAPGGVVCADNVFWSGAVWGSGARADDADTAGLRAFTDALLGDERWAATLLPVGDGLAVGARLR